MTDWQLLQQYVREGSHDAFKSLAQRHVDWIYAAAKRQVRDAHLASDVTQAVFVVLARKAASISENTSLSGWLFRTTRYCAMDAKKMDARRRYHERHAAMERTESIELESMEWREVTPQLDEAVARLSKRDRKAIVLRFYRDQSMSEIAAATGVSEEAAKKRVTRAVEKLRKSLARRGVKEIGAMAIASGLSAAIAEKAPAQVLQSVSGAAGNASATATQIASGALKMMFYAKLKLVAVIALLVLTPALVMLVHGATSTTNEAGTTQPAHWPDAAAANGGHILVCVWDVIVKQKTAQEIKSPGDEIAKLKDDSSLVAASSKELLDTLVQAKADNAVANVVPQLDWLDEGNSSYVKGFIWNSTQEKPSHRVPYSGVAGGIYELSQNNRTATLRFKANVNAYLGKPVQADVEFKRELHHGDCIVFVAPGGAMPEWGDLCHLMIFQAVQVSDDDIPRLRKTIDAPRWLETGLKGALHAGAEAKPGK